MGKYFHQMSFQSTQFDFNKTIKSKLFREGIQSNHDHMGFFSISEKGKGVIVIKA